MPLSFLQPTTRIQTSTPATAMHWLLSDNRARLGLGLAVIAIPCALFAFSPFLTRGYRTLTTKRESKQDPVRKPLPTPPSKHGLTATPTATPAPATTTALDEQETGMQAGALPLHLPPQPTARAPSPDHDPFNYQLEPDTFSLSSGASSETKPKKLRVGKNLKRAWNNRPFHAAEPTLSPETERLPASF